MHYGDEAYIFIYLENLQIPDVNPLNKLISVPEVVNLISLNCYQSWCIGFLGAYIKTDIVKACSNIKMVRSGTSTVTSRMPNPVHGTTTSM